jgi:uncharacterized protein YceK
MSRQVLFACVAVVVCGCGTMKNVSGERFPIPINDSPRSVYGGVRLDAKGAGALVSGRCDMPLLALAMTLDLPLSAVGDTVTLPYTLWYQLSKSDAAPDVSREESSTLNRVNRAPRQTPTESAVTPTAASQPRSP